MKDLIKKILKEETKDEYILEIPNLMFIPNVDLGTSEGITEAWNELLRLLKGKPFMFDDDLYLGGTKITSLGNLQSVNGNLSLYVCDQLTSLGDVESVVGNLNLRLCYKLTSLGNLRSVGGSLHLFDCINLSSLGDLQSVGGDLNLINTPLSKKYSEEEIRQMVDVKGEIYL